MRKQPDKFHPTTLAMRDAGWTAEHQASAMAEGWVLAHDKRRHLFHVQRLDTSSKFISDYAAYVWLECNHKSKPHRRLAWLLVK